MKSQVLAIGLSLLGLLLTAGCNRTPQMGGNEECMTAVDALWTAINVKQTELLDHSQAEIERLHTSGAMPDGAFENLSSIVTTARAGQWPAARAALRQFIRGQRPAPR
jgi:hypothetical protein